MTDVKEPYPDLEINPRQKDHDGDSQSHPPQIRHRKSKEREEILQHCFVKYGETPEDQAQALYQPNLWWFASTVFPLIAGTFGPIANLFSVCSLVKPWRIKNGDLQVPDPSWLTVLNSCSLFLAILANLTLLFNFARRIRYNVAQPLTISLWYLSCVFLVIPICLTRLRSLSPSTHPTFAYSESFYYAVISATIYFKISTLLLFNFIGTTHFFQAYRPTFAELTVSQRTLMLQTISFSLYLALGGGVFSAIEGWSFTDGVYWADYTLLTIGFGSDFPLTKTLARMLLIPYAAFGITLIGLIVTSVRGLVLERAKEKVAMRHLEKERDRWTDNIKKTLQNNDEPATVPRPRSLLFCWHYRQDKKFQGLPGVIEHAKSEQHQDKHGKWHHAEFELMRYIQMTAKNSDQYIALMVSFLAVLVVWVGGSLVFWALERKPEKWTYVESFYFTYTSLLTIGYGDFYPTTQAAKPFFVIWSLVAVPAMTVLIGNMGDTVVRVVQDTTDWMGRWTLLPEYREKAANEKEWNWVEVKNDQASSESDGIKAQSDQAFTSPTPSLSRGQILPVREHTFEPSPGEDQEAPAAPQVESPLEQRDEQKTALNDPYAFQKPHYSEAERSVHNQSQVQAEAALLAREISKLAKDVCQHPPKKYGWEELVTWLEMLGDEGVVNEGAMELAKEVSMNLPEAAADQNTQVEQPYGQHHHKHHHHHHHSHPNAQFNRHDQIREAGDGLQWHWTWLDDKGPLFSQQTEAEWILSKLCSRLEKLMNN